MDLLPILQFVFSGFWTFLGTALLLSIVVHGLARMVVALAYVWGGRRNG